MLGISGVDVASLECHLGHGGVEILIFQLADGSTVHGVGPVGTKQVDVKLVCALAYLLVWIEGYAYVAMLDFGVLLKILYCRDDFSYAGLVVSSEQSVSVGHDEILALIVEQFGKLGGREYDAVGLVERDVVAVIVLDYAGVTWWPLMSGDVSR